MLKGLAKLVLFGRAPFRAGSKVRILVWQGDDRVTVPGVVARVLAVPSMWGYEVVYEVREMGGAVHVFSPSDLALTLEEQK